jgi:type 1 glutamine amidotransferase
MAKRALVFWGGWEGHEPRQVAEIFIEDLQQSGFEVRVSDTLDSLQDGEMLRGLNLIVPVWTMGTISEDQAKNLADAVESGVGLAGCHGGMCDAFRDSPTYQFVTGGQWVAHPGNDGVKHAITITDKTHEITRGVADFTVATEQYYLHVDPANKVLATTHFPVMDGPHAVNGPVEMPVVWTRLWGQGRVFYCSLGHHADIVRMPEARTICRRGLLWAAREDAVGRQGGVEHAETRA